MSSMNFKINDGLTLDYITEHHLNSVNLFRIVGSYHISDAFTEENLNKLKRLNSFNKYKVHVQ